MLQTQHGKLKYPSDPLPPLKKFSGSAHVSRQPFYIFLLLITLVLMTNPTCTYMYRYTVYLGLTLKVVQCSLRKHAIPRNFFTMFFKYLKDPSLFP